MTHFCKTTWKKLICCRLAKCQVVDCLKKAETVQNIFIENNGQAMALTAKLDVRQSCANKATKYSHCRIFFNESADYKP